MRSDPLRTLRTLLPGAEVIRDPIPDAELYGGGGEYSEPPTVRQAEILEGSRLRAIRVPGSPVVAFGAFLDGAQRVRIYSHVRGVPAILGTVSAVVRERRNRRFVTWGHQAPTVQQRFYLPLHYLPNVDSSAAHPFEVVDTTRPDAQGNIPSRHPGALRKRALECVRADREQLEQRLAEAWCVREQTPLCIDGGISGSERVAVADCAVGVIKSHQTLYADGEGLDTVLSLNIGERSSVFRVTSRRRAAVMSWYLRVRDPRGQDATFGLIRVEVAERPDPTPRADEVSRWILAESAPLSLPDSRWDKMLYGIRDCEEFLRAIAS